MFDQTFFRSKLGQAAIVSLAAMLAFNVLAMSHEAQAQASPVAAAPFVMNAQAIELA